MSIPGSVNPLFLGAAGQATAATGYQIERSVRFNSPDSAYLSRTPASSSNRRTWTWAGWVKLSSVTTAPSLFMCRNGGGDSGVSDFIINSDGTVVFTGAANTFFTTTQVLRDFSAWYHLVLSVDTTAATAGNRIRFYLNGSQVTTFNNSYNPTQNFELAINQAAEHDIGGKPAVGEFFNGYLADIHFIDGQALDPSSFGEFDTNGVWQPIDASGLTYGTNGFHLPFSDNSTAAALGTDTSSNGNTWTVNNISVGAGGNTSQYWSATASIAGQAGYEATKAFDGDASSASSTYYFPGTDGTGTFTFAQSVPYSTIKIWYGRNNGRLFVNGVDMEIATTGYAEIDQAYLASKGVTSPLVSIGLERVIAGNGAYLFGVQVNGSQLIDTIYNAGNDSLVDSPTNGSQTDTGVGGEVVGNYCTWNPLGTAGPASSNGNLDIASSSTAGNKIGTILLTSGKWYWECVGDGYAGAVVGVGGEGFTSTISSNGSKAIGYWSGGGIYWDGGSTPSQLASYTTSDVIGIAVDMTAGTVAFYKNNSLVYTATFGSGTVPNLSSGVYPGFNTGNPGGSARTVVANFGQRQWAYAAPAGFKALCTTNLDSETITTSGSYTGNGVADGPFVYLNGVPTAMTVGGNAVTFGTHADKLSNGFKIRTTSTTYNQNTSTYNYTITSTGDPFKRARAQANP